MDSVRRSQRAKSSVHSPRLNGPRSGRLEPIVASAWQSFLDGLMDGVLVVDADGHCVFGNVSARAFLELSALEIKGRMLGEFVVQENGREIEVQPDSGIVGREPLAGRFLRGDRTHFSGEYLAQPLPPECGSGIVVTFRPKTRGDERRKIARAFTSGIAHDLNNLLSPVIMATEVLRSSPSPETIELALGIIEQAAKRGVALVGHIVQSSRELPAESKAPQPHEALRSDPSAGSTGSIQIVPQPSESSKAIKKGQHR